MSKIPKKILKCPISESVFEIRYSSTYPVDAIFGILYSAVKDIFPNSEPKPLPILQLPEAVRLNDPNFKYQAYHRLENDNLILNIGPKMISFINTYPYLGWLKWSDFFNNLLKKIQSTNCITNIERIGLRYINIFKNTNIFNKLNLEIMINNNKLLNEATNLRTEIKNSEWTNVLQINNSIDILMDNEKINASIIDIDCLLDLNINSTVFFDSYQELISNAHKQEKELFFSLLTNEFLNSLNPIWE